MSENNLSMLEGLALSDLTLEEIGAIVVMVSMMSPSNGGIGEKWKNDDKLIHVVRDLWRRGIMSIRFDADENVNNVEIDIRNNQK